MEDFFRGSKGQRGFRHTLRKLTGLAKVLTNLPFVDLTKLSLMMQAMKGVHDRNCPICGFNGRFTSFGSPPRWDAQCPQCGSLERHRLLYLAIDREHGFKPEAALLHFAPEFAVRQFVEPLVAEYVTTNISGQNVDLILDIQNLDLPNESYDVVLCSHILEHVDDNRALSEMFRILRPGGQCFVMTPVIEGWDRSYENAAVDGPKERDLHFGQLDHVRYFGSDIRDRIKSAGFMCSEFTAFGQDCVDYGLWRGEKVFVGSRPD